ncbi:MAG: hypothetical protein LBS89_04935 [Zoogloeaceae bacterium]|jgi:hypothetical protein|nr:hypothetical protein [Zoogloeaceae bacterium]
MALDVLQAYPHILEALKVTWGYPECGVYLDNILLQERGTMRQGFDFKTYETLETLRDLHHFLYPPSTNPKQDTWGESL